MKPKPSRIAAITPYRSRKYTNMANPFPKSNIWLQEFNKLEQHRLILLDFSPFRESPWWNWRCPGGYQCLWPSQAYPCGRWRCWTGCDLPPTASPWTWCPSHQMGVLSRWNQSEQWCDPEEGHSVGAGKQACEILSPKNIKIIRFKIVIFLPDFWWEPLEWPWQQCLQTARYWYLQRWLFLEAAASRRWQLLYPLSQENTVNFNRFGQSSVHLRCAAYISVLDGKFNIISSLQSFQVPLILAVVKEDFFHNIGPFNEPKRLLKGNKFHELYGGEKKNMHRSTCYLKSSESQLA